MKDISERKNQRQGQMMENMMENMKAMQEQNLLKQQQMIRDDPECKQLFDQHTNLTQQIFAATLAGDQAGQIQARSELMALGKNAKYMKLMMPAMSDGAQMKTMMFGKEIKSTQTGNMPLKNTGTSAAFSSSHDAVTTDPSSMFSAVSQFSTNNSITYGGASASNFESNGFSSGGGFDSNAGGFGSTY